MNRFHASMLGRCGYIVGFKRLNEFRFFIKSAISSEIG